MRYGHREIFTRKQLIIFRDEGHRLAIISVLSGCTTDRNDKVNADIVNGQQAGSSNGPLLSANPACQSASRMPNVPTRTG
jgi:hypothetical protein